MAEPTPTTLPPEPPAPVVAEPPAPAEAEPTATAKAELAAPVEVELTVSAEVAQAEQAPDARGASDATAGPAPVRKGRRAPGPIRDSWWGAALALAAVAGLFVGALMIWSAAAPPQRQAVEHFYPIGDGAAFWYTRTNSEGVGQLGWSSERLTGIEVNGTLPFNTVLVALGQDPANLQLPVEEVLRRLRWLHVGRQSRAEIDAAGVLTSTENLVLARGDELMLLTTTDGRVFAPPAPLLDLALAIGVTREVTGTLGGDIPYVARLTYEGEAAMTTTLGEFAGCRRYHTRFDLPSVSYQLAATSWYCPEVGLVREEYTASTLNGPQVLELAGYSVGGRTAQTLPPEPRSEGAGANQPSWSVPFTAPLDPIWSHLEPGSNPAVSTPPLPVGDLVLFGTENGALVAFNQATRTVEWRFQTGGLINNAPVVSDGVVYFGAHDRKLYAVDLATGLLRWSFATGDVISGSPALDDQHVYVGSHDHKLYAVERTSGRLVWEQATDGAIAATPVVAQGAIYVGSADKGLYAFDSSGVLRWRFIAGQAITSAVVVADNVVYLSSYDGAVYALVADSDDPDGTVLWENTIGITFQSPPILADGRLFFAGQGWLYVLDPATGEAIWHSPDERELVGEPLVFADRVLMRDENTVSLVSLAVADGSILADEPLPDAADFDGPTSDGSRLYLGDDDGYLAAYGLNGPLAWKPRPRWQTLLPQDSTSLDIFVAPPIIDGERVLFVSGTGVVLGLDRASGALQKLGTIPGGGPFTAPLALEGNTLYARIGKNAFENALVAFDLRRGAARWSVPVSAGFYRPLVVDGRVLVFGTAEGRNLAEAFDADTGASLWQRDLGGGFGNGSVLSGGRWLVAAGAVYALDPATGEELATSANLNFGDLIVEGATVYSLGITEEGLRLVALDVDTLTERWQAPVTWRNVYPNLNGALAAGGGHIAVYFLDGSLTVYDDSGSELWHTAGTSKPKGRPLIANGHIIVATDRHHLLAYALEDGALQGDLTSRNAGTRHDLSNMAPVVEGDTLYVALEHSALAVQLEETQ